jgi:hypothetical protein
MRMVAISNGLPMLEYLYHARKTRALFSSCTITAKITVGFGYSVLYKEEEI